MAANAGSEPAACPTDTLRLLADAWRCPRSSSDVSISSTHVPAARGPRRLGRFRDWFAYSIGITGDPRATRRFFRATFIVRGFLLATTPFFFLLPGPQYEGGMREWATFIGLVIWTGFFASLTYRSDEYVKSTNWIYVADLVVTFAAFLFMTRSATGSDTTDSYRNVVIVGAFQLQTYGAAITAGALTGVPGGLASGLASALVYVACLWRIDHGALHVHHSGSYNRGGLFDPAHFQGTVARAAFYLIAGFNFGLYNSLVGRLRHEMRVAAENEIRASAAAQFHRRGLNRLDAIAHAFDGAARDAPDAIRSRIERANKCLRETAASLRRAFTPAGEIGRAHASSVISDACSVLRLLASDDRPLAVDVVESGQTYLLDPGEAQALEEIVIEAISNAIKHAEEGTIRVLGHPVDGGYEVRVTDPGPPVEPAERDAPDSGYGLRDIQDLCAAFGWLPSVEVSRTAGTASIVAVVLPRREGRKVGGANPKSMTETSQEVDRFASGELADAWDADTG